MEVMIGLARADYEKLVNDVPIGSCAYIVLHRSPQQLHRLGGRKTLLNVRDRRVRKTRSRFLKLLGSIVPEPYRT
jgi:hypothetical protein